MTPYIQLLLVHLHIVAVYILYTSLSSTSFPVIASTRSTNNASLFVHYVLNFFVSLRRRFLCIYTHIVYIYIYVHCTHIDLEYSDPLSGHVDFPSLSRHRRHVPLTSDDDTLTVAAKTHFRPIALYYYYIVTVYILCGNISMHNIYRTSV